MEVWVIDLELNIEEHCLYENCPKKCCQSKFLLSIDPSLKEAYYLKEQYREFNLSAQYETCDDEFQDLISKFQSSELEEFREFGKLLSRWKEYIKNSFIRFRGRRLSNGPIEGIHSRIKIIYQVISLTLHHINDEERN